MKKKIDSLFKNGMDRPQKSPEDAWDYIQSHLPSERDDRIIPFWKKSLGIALLLIGLTGAGIMIGKNNWFSNQNNNKNLSRPIATKHSNNSDAKVLPESNQNKTNLIIDEQEFNASENQYGTNYSQVVEAEFNSKKSDLNKSNTNTQPTYYSNNLNYQNQQSNSFIAILTQDYQRTLITQNELNLSFDLINPSDLSKSINFKPEVEITATQDNKISKQNKQKSKVKMDFDRFYVSGFISPTGLNTFVGASMLSDNLNDYKTENAITLAYGVKAAYSLSPKFRIRTGISMVGFEQITKNVMMTTGFSDQPFTIEGTGNNIDYSGNLRVLNPRELSDVSYRFSDGDVQQQSQFIEIPIEAEFSVFRSGSIGISVTGGGSTWLLSKNKIYVQTDGHTEELGKANNLNKTSFSANAGVKFDLKLSDNMQFNVEPGFKYLINPVSNIQKYSPYTVGVNAGISIRLK